MKKLIAMVLAFTILTGCHEDSQPHVPADKPLPTPKTRSEPSGLGMKFNGKPGIDMGGGLIMGYDGKIGLGFGL